MKIKLEWYERKAAINVGVDRRIEAEREKKGEPNGKTPNWNDDIYGAEAEVVFAKATGLYWDASINTYKTKGDVGPWEVRFSREEWLIIRDRDADDKVYFCVTGTFPDYEIIGGMRAGDAKKLTHLINDPNQRKAAWFIPRSYLTPFEDLRKELGI